MRRRARTDANHAEVVKAFRDLNCKYRIVSMEPA
jgi:hypothetical protein